MVKALKRLLSRKRVEVKRSTGLSKEKERVIERAVRRTVEEYGETLKLLGNE